MGQLPDRDPLPRYVAPLPRALEDFGFRMVWVIVLVNLTGTMFGFWFYRSQFAAEPFVVWPVVPDSPTATLFIAVSLGLWRLGRSQEWVNALAFFGCIELGFWTPFVLLVYQDGFSYLHPAMYHFLFWSHLAMVAEAFLIHRYSDFPLWAIAIAVVWYGFNDLVDYFIPIIGEPHHTWIPSELVDGDIVHTVVAHDVAAGGAVTLSILATVLAVSTYRHKQHSPSDDMGI